MAQQTTAPEGYPLASKERSEKLALALHLISNTKQPVVVVGPKGIGKTKLLEMLAERKKNTWHCHAVPVDAQSTGEAIIKMISGLAGMDAGAAASQPQTATNGPTRLLFLVDNAGQIPPGELSVVMEHLLANPMLRAIFAMTPDEFFIKNRTDTLIDDCPIIELPPLSRNQCEELMRFLATQPKFRLPITRISEPMIETVYRESQGIPGHIIGKFSQLAQVKQIDHTPWLLLAAAVALVAIALAVQWFSTNGM